MKMQRIKEAAGWIGIGAATAFGVGLMLAIDRVEACWWWMKDWAVELFFIITLSVMLAGLVCLTVTEHPARLKQREEHQAAYQECLSKHDRFICDIWKGTTR